jgi:hypothetical protein
VADNQMTPEDASNLLYQQVYVPTFLQKLASLGHDIPSEAHAQSLLRQGQMLRIACAHEQVKQAAANNDPLLIAEQRLRDELIKTGAIASEDATELEKYAGDIVQARPDLAQAAIAYQNGVAQQQLAQAG